MSVSINLNTSNASSGAGIDVTSVVDQILYADRANERLWQAQQATLNSQNSALTALGTYLSDLQNKVNDLKDVFGSLNAMAVTSSQPSLLSASAQPSAAPGTHLVNIASLATTSSYYTEPLADSSTTFATGSFDLSIGGGGPATITVDETNNTLDKLAAYINGEDLGVSASVVTDASGARLALISDLTGQPGDLTIGNNSTGLVFDKALTGRNASLTVDGLPISSNTNTVSNVIPGVTLNLLGQSAGDIRLTVAADTEAAGNAIAAFVGSYNGVTQAINNQFAVDPNSGRAGPLATNSVLRALQANLLSDVSYSLQDNHGIVNLASLGLDMANDGTLTIDSAKLDDALANHLDDFRNFFQSTGTVTGFAYNFSNDLNTLNGPSSGLVAVNLAEISNTQKMLTDTINDFEDHLAVRQQYLIKQYSQVDVMLRQLPLLQAQITDQLNVFNNYS